MPKRGERILLPYCLINDEYCSNGGRAICKDLCKKHYERQRIHGDPRISKHNRRPRPPSPGEYWCGGCKDFKASDQFSPSHTGAGQTVCRACVAERNRACYDPDAYRERHLKRKYGIGLAEYHRLLTLQGGHCATCPAAPLPGEVLDVDHDHKTGTVRGLLCRRCNRALGYVGDSIELLKALAVYLERTSSYAE